MKTLLLSCLFLACTQAQTPPPPPPSLQIFTFFSGDTLCRATKVTGKIIRFSYYCASSPGSHERGATAGSYTAYGAAQDVLTIGLSSSILNPITLIPTGGVTCLITINASPSSPFVFGSIGTAPPNGIAWSCSGSNFPPLSGTAVWP